MKDTRRQKLFNIYVWDVHGMVTHVYTLFLICLTFWRWLWSLCL